MQRMVVMSSGELEGVADVDPYGVQWQVRQRPVPACFTALELLPQCPGVGLYVRGREAVEGFFSLL
jgi:hypothetical protein